MVWKRKQKGGVITISLEMTEKKLLINIHDDGIGIDEEELIKINQRLEITSGPLTKKRKRGGIALPNVSRRIKLLFGDEYGIHIYSIPNLGTEIQDIGTDHYKQGAEKSVKRELLNIEGGKIKKGNNVIFDDLSLERLQGEITGIVFDDILEQALY